MQISSTEENYLKEIFHLCEESQKSATSTNVLAGKLGIKPASVTAMLKKLRDKELINYQRYGDVSLTILGNEIAIGIIRKHRLWEVFLVETLGFTWDEVHEVAEQLEHINSKKLIDKLDAFLLYPKVDPHGDPIPSATGELKQTRKRKLSDAKIGKTYQIVAVSDNSSEFLQFLFQKNIGLGTQIEAIQKHAQDQTILIELSSGKRITFAIALAKNIHVV